MEDQVAMEVPMDRRVATEASDRAGVVGVPMFSLPCLRLYLKYLAAGVVGHQTLLMRQQMPVAENSFRCVHLGIRVPPPLDMAAVLGDR